MNLEISSDQLTMLYFMAGLSVSKIPETYKKEFDDLMEQMDKILRTELKELYKYDSRPEETV